MIDVIAVEVVKMKICVALMEEISDVAKGNEELVILILAAPAAQKVVDDTNDRTWQSSGELVSWNGPVNWVARKMQASQQILHFVDWEKAMSLET